MLGNCKHKSSHAGLMHDTNMHRILFSKLVNVVATMCMRATHLHRVDVRKSPGGRILNGGFGGSCCKAAHAQAGAEVVVLHLQMYAHMQIEAPGPCPAPLGPAMWTASDACLQGLARSLVLQAHTQWRQLGWFLGCQQAVYTHSHMLSSSYRVQGVQLKGCSNWDMASECTKRGGQA